MRSPLGLSTFVAVSLVACSASPPPETKTAPPALAATPPKAATPVALVEPLQPPVVSPAPVAPAAPVASLPEEPLSDPVDTTFSSPTAPKGPAAGPGATKPPSVRMGATKPASGEMWGDEIGDSFGAGGLGLAGMGEGGGGKADGIGLGTIGTIGHGAGTGSGAGVAAQQLPSGVRTGEWDDNANLRELTKWLAKEDAPGTAKLDFSSRRFVVVRDSAGLPVPSCLVDIADSSGASPALTLTTSSTGRALLFPRIEGIKSRDVVATARCQGLVAAKTANLAASDGVIDIQLPVARTLPEVPTVDVAFVLDTTGSMGEEINAMRDTLTKVAASLGTLGVRPRAGLVEYRDRGDTYVTRLHQMTTDLPGLGSRIGAVSAGGGGDGPEHVNEALRVAVRGLHFNRDSVARLVFLIGDAPPHLDYQGDEGYAPAMKEANHAGIQIYTIAASGMDEVGQVVWRQIAAYTQATNMFVLRGGAGPQSVGGGDPLTSCGGSRTDYTSANLDALIISKVTAAMKATKSDPMRIAGLFRDEKDLPCDQRVSQQ